MLTSRIRARRRSERKVFFDTRFSGPLLDEANNGEPGTLGRQGESGKVGCVSCHVPASGFSDTRSTRGQISLGAGLTHRRAKSLLDVAQSSLLDWDGRRDSAFSQPFTPLEDPIEMNSSRLFVAQQIARLYRTEHQAIFGSLPALDAYAPVAAADAGCSELPTGVIHGSCVKLGADDSEVTRVIVNMGKAIEAYTRQLTCGASRFDAWVVGNSSALDADEQAGALLFVGKAGCDRCHAGPYLSDHSFHNVGLHPDFRFFVVPIDDPGAESVSPRCSTTRSIRWARTATATTVVSTRSPETSPDSSVRSARRACAACRRSFMHTGQFRSLEDVVDFFDRGGDTDGFLGSSENFPRHLSSNEKTQLVAFLRALDGSGPDPALIEPPVLPPEPDSE